MISGRARADLHKSYMAVVYKLGVLLEGVVMISAMIFWGELRSRFLVSTKDMDSMEHCSRSHDVFSIENPMSTLHMAPLSRILTIAIWQLLGPI